MKLNLTAKTPEQAVIKQYLEQNASEELANKINKGLPVEKDGRALISRKDLDGFMKFATEEARKQASKGAQSACVQDSVVFGWAIHYFEENSIPGTLYNPDGSLYALPKPVQKKDTPKPAPVQKPKARNDLDQVSMLDLMSADEAVDEPDSEVSTEIEEVYTLPGKVDPATGEVVEDPVDPYADTELMCKIFALLDNQIEIVR